MIKRWRSLSGLLVHRSPSLLVLPWLVFVACTDVTGPAVGVDAWVFAIQQPASLIGVSVARGVVTRIPLRFSPDYVALSADRTQFISSAGAGGSLIGWNIDTGRKLWSETLSSTFSLSALRLDRWNGITIWGSGAIAESGDSNLLFLGGAFRGDSTTAIDTVAAHEGVVVLDSKTRNLVGFISPLFLEVLGVTAVPAGSEPGYMVLAGRRARYPAVVDDWMYKVDVSKLAIVDSVHGGVSVAPHRLAELQYSPAAGAIYAIEVADVVRLVKLAWPSLAVTASAPSPGFAYFTTAPDGTLYRTVPDQQTGTYALVHYDTNLHETARLDLGRDPDSATPFHVDQLTVNPAGDRVYITTGTAPATFEGTPQESRLLVVDALQWKLLKSIDLGGKLAAQEVVARR